MLKENQVYNFKYLSFNSNITIIRSMPGNRWMIRNSQGQVFTQPENVIQAYIERGIYTLIEDEV